MQMNKRLAHELNTCQKEKWTTKVRYWFARACLLLAVLLGQWTVVLLNGTRPCRMTDNGLNKSDSSIGRSLCEAFPGLAPQLAQRAEFTSTVRSVDGRSIQGFIPVGPRITNEAATAENVLLFGLFHCGFQNARTNVPPPGLNSQEQAAGLAANRRCAPTSAGALKLFFPSNYSDPSIVNAGELEIHCHPLGASAAAGRVEDGRLVYSEAYPQADILYSIIPGRSEEFILLKSADAPRRFEYELAVLRDGVRPKAKDGGFTFVDKKGQVLRLDAPYVIDANGVRSTKAVHWELESLDDKKNVTVPSPVVQPLTPRSPFDRLMAPSCVEGLSLTSAHTPRGEGMEHYRLALVLEPAGLSYPIVIDPSWSSTDSLGTVRTGHTATLLQNGKVLVAGGRNNGGELSSAELYDPDTGLWSGASALGTVRYNHTATLLPDGTVLVAGGNNTGNGPLNSAELYDPNSDSWSSTVSFMNGSRHLHTATLLNDGTVLVSGGTGISPLATAELYDPASGAWTLTGSMSTARDYHTATLLVDGTVLVAGGFDDLGGYPTGAEKYDPVGGVWSAAGSLNVSRSAHIATLLSNGKVLVAGGYNGSYLNDSELYNPAGDIWTPITSSTLSVPRGYCSATLLPNGTVLVAGGQGISSNAEMAVDLYDPIGDMWSSTGSLIGERENHTATLLANGKVLVVGGDSNAIIGATSELYDSAMGFWSSIGASGAVRLRHTATLLPDGQVLVVGGSDGSSELASAELYDPLMATLIATGSMSKARMLHKSTLLANGKVLVSGGFNGIDGFLVDCELYDPVGGTWSATGPLGTARKFHTATLLADGRVLVAGGTNGSATSSAEVYNPSTGTWSPTGNLGVARMQHTATLLLDGSVVVIGGGDGVGELASAESFDPDTGTWSASGNLGEARSFHTASLLPDGSVLIAGGINMGSILSSSEFFSMGTFINAGTMNEGRESHAAVLLPNGKVLVSGGVNDGDTSSAELYDPAKGAWTSTSFMNFSRNAHTLTLLPDGAVLAVGGNTGIPELFDVGLGYSNVDRPVISSVAPIISPGSAFSVTGSGFRGYSEASGGGSQSSSTGYPLLQLRSLENEQTRFIPPNFFAPWSDASFDSDTINDFPAGYALVTVFTNGLPSISSIVLITGPASRLKIIGSAFQSAGTVQSLSIVAKDFSDNNVLSYSGDATLTFSGANPSTSPVTMPTVTDKNGMAIVFGSPTVITFSNGVASPAGQANGGLALFKVETAAVAVTDGSTIPEPFSISVLPSALNNFAFTLTSPQTNALPFTGVNTLTARDAFGNTVTGFSSLSDNVTITVGAPLTGAVTGLGSGSNNILNQSSNFNSGVADLTALGMKYTGKSSTGTFTATSSTAKVGTSGSTVMNPGAFAMLQILVPGESAAPGTGSGKTGVPTGQTAGTAFGVTVNAVDANFNVVNAADTIGLTSTDAAASLPTNAALASGTQAFSIALLTIGTQTVTATDITDGTKTASTSGSITVSTVVPSVTSVSPTSGSANGGTSVMITGLNFGGLTGVTFGGTAATAVTLVNATSITCTTPAMAAGVVNIVVTTSTGSGTLIGGFTFIAAPTLSSITPAAGMTSGGAAVTLSGTNFSSGATVSFGGIAATSITVASSTSISCVTPAHEEGVVDVVVTSNGISATLSAGFTYLAPNSGGEGTSNISTDKDPIENPLNGIKVKVVNSDGGVVEFDIDVDSLTRDAFTVSTNFTNVGRGSLSKVVGTKPVQKFVDKGLYVATVTATEVATDQPKGKARKMIGISARETGEANALPAPASTEITMSKLSGKFQFVKTTPDMVSFSGTIELAEGFDTSTSHDIYVGMGNITAMAMVDAKGRAILPSLNGIIKKLQIKYPRKGTTAKVSFTLMEAGMSANGFDTEGVSADVRAEELSLKKIPRSIQVGVVIGGVAYETLVPADFKLTVKQSGGQLVGRSGQ